ncbi:MAG: sulfatase-like hydrolase/transferase [Actinobacteria bacterium]|nr:sulfatase-like hydrolase/transferase [Actinomycetota bacterium]
MTETDRRDGGLTRKQLLGAGAAATATAFLSGAGVERALAANAGGGKGVAGMNVILFITDQEREIQHFPPNWLRQNLPGMRRLRRHGLSFETACTSACMCSPSRSSMMTGYFPAQHGVKYTLEEEMPATEFPQVNLPTGLPNLGTVMRAAGYQVAYKGKWHCSKPATKGHAVPADLEKYGFEGWDPPDAGGNQTVPEAGGGYVDNDGRFMESKGKDSAGAEGALQYLDTVTTQKRPFFLVISLVNPHDVLFYPSRTFEEAGYDNSWLSGDIRLPPTVDESLSSKPSVQEEFLHIMNLTGVPRREAEKRAYLNFYGNLMRSSDNYLVDVLDKLEEKGLYDDTLIIRTSDHGEMGLSHGGLRQKNFNFYEETLKVPLVYSNPKLFPKAKSSEALVSHVDLLPTLASLVDAPKAARRNWAGVDYSDLVLNPDGGKTAQDYVVFTYDDFQSGQSNGLYPKPPNHIVSIREERWKLAKYHDVEVVIEGETPVSKRPAKPKPPQWEMYDLKRDPHEEKNLAAPGYERTPLQEREFRRLQKKLEKVEKARLRPLAAA